MTRRITNQKTSSSRRTSRRKVSRSSVSQQEAREIMREAQHLAAEFVAMVRANLARSPDA